MSLKTWWLFVLVTFFLSATPGPNMLLVMASSARFGLSKAVSTMAGCMTALLAMMSLSALGLGAVLQAFPPVFNALRWLGAAYLLYLGIRSWLAPVPIDGEQSSLASATPSPRLYRQGFLVAASNPKAILFAAAFLPQFIRPDSPKLPQFAILLMTFAVIEVSWYWLYAGSGRRLSRYLTRASVVKYFNRLTGSIFIVFAGAILFARES